MRYDPGLQAGVSEEAADDGTLESLGIEPLIVSRLGEIPEPDYIIDGLVARGCLTGLVAPPKRGKSTLMYQFVRDMLTGDGFAYGKLLGSGVLVLTEEPNTLWMRRHRLLGLPDGVQYLTRREVRGLRFDSLCARVARAVHDGRYRLVLVDTVHRFWQLSKENDAAEMGAAMDSLRRITEAGAGVVAVHHPNKGHRDGDSINAGRGSSAFGGEVDFHVLMTVAQDDPACRTLTIDGRDGLFERVVWFDGEWYHPVAGGAQEVRQRARRAIVEEVLPADDWWRWERVQEEWRARHPKVDGAGKNTLPGFLVWGAKQGWWRQRGTGSKGDAFHFQMIPPIPPYSGGGNDGRSGFVSPHSHPREGVGGNKIGLAGAIRSG